MKLKSLINNGGATLTLKGNKSKVKNGYMVSYEDNETIYQLNAINQVKLNEIIKEYETIARNKKAYIGLWIDEGKSYVDLSEKINNLDVAIKIGNDRKQLGIYDIKNMETIDLKQVIII